MKIKIEKMGINGEGIGYNGKKPVFVPGALIEEECQIEIIESNRTYDRGKVQRITKESEHRVRPRCAIQNRCGACSLMIADYDQQLVYKRDLLKQALIKYAQVNPRLIEKVIPNPTPYSYRNQCKLPLQMEENVLESGMYIPGSNFFISVDECKVHELGIDIIRRKIMEILNEFKMKPYDYHQKKGIRSLIVRVFDNKFQVTLVTGDHPIVKAMVEKLMEIEGMHSLWQSVNIIKKGEDLFGPKITLLAGERMLPIVFDELRLSVTPRPIFRLNTPQTKKLYEIVVDMVGNRNNLIVDAYCGIGAISILLKDKSKEIIGIESMKDAIVCANANAQANGCENVKFICADAPEKLTYISKKQTIDTLIVDPPRTGLDDEMLLSILKSKIKNIIYISSNPATLGKNIAILKERYEVKRIVPMDFFSHTAHVESIVSLKRIGK